MKQTVAAVLIITQFVQGSIGARKPKTLRGKLRLFRRRTQDASHAHASRQVQRTAPRMEVDIDATQIRENIDSRDAVVRGNFAEPSPAAVGRSRNEHMMQLGFVSAILAEQSLEEVLATAVELGYDCVELMCWPIGKADRRYAGVTHVDVTGFDETRAADVRGLASRYGVAISALGYYPNPLSPDAAEAGQAIAHLRQTLIAASMLGIGRVNTFVGRDWTRSLHDNWPRFLDVWKPLVELAEQHQVRIAIENCPMLFTHDEWPGGKNLAVSPAIWRKMFAAIPSRHFGLNYDPSHLVWQQMNYTSPLCEFANRIFHVHAKDVRIDRRQIDDVGILATPLEYHSPKLPGLGEIDWGRFVAALGDIGYQGPVCVEVEDRSYEHSPAARRLALRQSCTFLRNFIPRDPHLSPEEPA